MSLFLLATGLKNFTRRNAGTELVFRSGGTRTATAKRFSHTAPLPDSRNLYEILGVEQTATPKELKAAFIRRSKEKHPDLNPDDKTLHKEFISLAEAYRILRSPYLRKDYDRDLKIDSDRGYDANRAGDGMAASSEPQAETRPSSRIHYPRQVILDPNDPNSWAPGARNIYGIKGVQRVPNRVILYVCFTIMFLGLVIHYLAYRRDTKRSDAIAMKLNGPSRPASGTDTEHSYPLDK